MIRIDLSQFEQVLMNLALNARDAMPDGGRLLIESEVVNLGNKGKYMLLKVKDTGVGMSKKTLSNIFEPFFTTKEVGEGIGLGLATVHGIVMESQGHIEVNSEPNKGTEFRLFFPIIHP